MAEKIYNLFHLGYPDIREWIKETDVVMVPLGSCEQHGLHLPVCTDSVAAEVAVQKAAPKANVPYVPTVWFGFSPQHMRGPGEGMGTITLRAETYQNLLYDVGRCLIHHGFDKIVFVTGHTSNIKVLDPMLRAIRYDTGALPFVIRADAEGTPPILADITENPPEETPGWHGSEIETSSVMYYNEKLVHLERTDQDRTHAPRWLDQSKFSKENGSPYVKFNDWYGYYIPMDHHEYSDTGLVGNPFRATKEKGERIFERISDHMAEFLKEIKGLQVEVKNRAYGGRV